VRDANRSFSFIFESFAAFRKEPGLSIGAIISPHSEGAGCDPINPGLVLAACYIYFVYPRETAFRAIDVTEDDLRSFHLSEPVAPDEVLRGLRNCLSHGRFSIDDEGTFTFCDRESAHALASEYILVTLGCSLTLLVGA